MKTGHVPLNLDQLQRLSDGGDLRVRLKPGTTELTIALGPAERITAKLNSIVNRIDQAVKSAERRG